METEETWEDLPCEEREDILKYLALLKRSKRVDLPFKTKKWILEHCDCKTWLAPTDLDNKYILD